ncbi:YjcZ family sporulation protein [Amphibacillus xylanus]|uniref:Sporulation protein YjcZ n=1 Tax=Amphibacillus xylanus (strain ATCC 51415 / DSM 6626 / JCM 7361 / LMG 17667 / NBRC 15112 / Ep01) TaxID=698758 RepID=K0IZB5_AMPXN|nr:YjcZ family sporulation protein [Amphibacillus xylanus]BAM47829.1 hypothetical protein AXY_16970 [Amphibacillus xylanus NBRC 15112]
MYDYGCCYQQPVQQPTPYRYGGGFALIVVLFILLIIVGASFY